MVKSSRIFGATMSVNAAGSEYSTRELTIYRDDDCARGAAVSIGTRSQR